MACRICSADDHSFVVPAESSAQFWNAVTKRQTTPASRRFIGRRAMDQQIGMDRDLTSSQRNIHHSAVAFDVGDSSIEDACVVGSFSPMIEQSKDM